mmetsp:Transcript_51611/g.142896  ORF Transcript_51611/g.142896 Transcript_51611/m.142896 type:complete len:356 (+) Transcript_51611:228-1295(+)
MPPWRQHGQLPCEDHKDHGHVVTPKATGPLQVRREALVEQLLHDFGGPEAAVQELLQSEADEVDDLLAAEDIPDAVTGHNHEFVGGLTSKSLHVWDTGDHLLLRWQAGIRLVPEVADGPREAQVPVHAEDRPIGQVVAENAAASVQDPRALGQQVGLVVLRQFHCLAVTAEHCPAVARISNDEPVVADAADHCRAADPVRVDLPHGEQTVRQGTQHREVPGVRQHLVHSHKGGAQRAGDVVAAAPSDFSRQMELAEAGHLLAPVPVHDCEERRLAPAVAALGRQQAGPHNVCVLHRIAPALHATVAPEQPSCTGSTVARVLLGARCPLHEARTGRARRALAHSAAAHSRTKPFPL